MNLDNSQQSDEQLAKAAAREASDGPAFQTLVARHEDRIWRVCCRLMGNAEDANDAAQEVLVRMFLNRAKFAGDSAYTTWVHGIALRTCLMMRRGFGRRRRREAIAGEERSRQRNDSAEQVESAMDVMKMLDTLNDEDRAMMILKYAEGYGYDELAAMFDLSVSACKMRLSRARERLQQAFPEHQFGGDE